MNTPDLPVAFASILLYIVGLIVGFCLGFQSPQSPIRGQCDVPAHYNRTATGATHT